MRKIEERIIEAVSAGKIAQFSKRDSTDINSVYLWGNLIFKITSNFVQFCFCGWNTATTKSRINALLHNFYDDAYIYQKDFELFINIKGIIYHIDSDKTYRIQSNVLSVKAFQEWDMVEPWTK